MDNDARYFEIMARVDAWADANAGWNCRDAAVAEVNFLLYNPVGYLSDDDIFDCACIAWMEAERSALKLANVSKTPYKKMAFERKPFQVRSEELLVNYTPEQNTDMWVVTVLTPHDEFKGGLPILDKLQDNATVERDYNYFSSHWQDYDVSFLVD